MRKIIIFAVLAVSMLIIGSFALAAKPDSPPGLSKEKNLKAPGHWKKTTEYETQRHFVNDVHSRILSRLQERGVFPAGLMRLVEEFFLEFGLLETTESEEETKYEVSGEVSLDEEGQAILDDLLATFEGLEEEYELKLKVKKQDDIVTVERNETVGGLTETQQELWNNLVNIVKSLVQEAEGDDVELEIEIEHELEIEEEEIEEPEPEPEE
ncbi:hypothetical protein MBGDC06_00434 [Thermoplasmatales archaeon SCGC AB-539-C06]|nr:hypothetical protein MBGDC06_00434 [Thermoplasmatales archaeon SCGC AB-539-C06]